MVVSPQTLVRIFIFILYTLLSLFGYRWLFPRLLPTARRLATGLLIAQVLVIAVSIEFGARLDLDEWLWDLNQDWNIPSTLASAQLALIGSVAIVTAWFSRAQGIWRRLYLVAIGLIFLFMARDEYAAFHEAFLGWERYYATLGLAVVLATLLVTYRTPRRLRIWQACFLAGLALSATGGLVIEQLRPQLQGPVCGNLGWLRLEGCLYTYQYEESLEFAGMWLALLGVLGQFSSLSPRPGPRARRLLYFLPMIWVLALVVDPLSHRQFLVRPASVSFESDVELHDFRVEIRADAVAVELDSSAREDDGAELGLSVHLVDQVGGQSVAGHDSRLCCQQSAQDGRSVLWQRLEVQVPPDAPVNRALWIVLTVWREEDEAFMRQQVLSSHLRQLDETQVILGELVIPAYSAAAVDAVLARFDNGFALEWVELPELAETGEWLSVEFGWRSEEAGGEELAQFLHFVREGGGEWWGYDQLPLGARLPTRLWYAGLADSETWLVPLPAGLETGRYAVYTGLYRLSDGERVAVSDAEGKPWLDNRAWLGSMIIAG